MKFSIADLHTDRQWRSATGLDQNRFHKLLALLPAAYEQTYGQSIEKRQAECPQEPALNTYSDLLLFTLFSRSGAPVKVRLILRLTRVDYRYGWVNG